MVINISVPARLLFNLDVIASESVMTALAGGAMAEIVDKWLAAQVGKNLSAAEFFNAICCEVELYLERIGLKEPTPDQAGARYLTVAQRQERLMRRNGVEFMALLIEVQTRGNLITDHLDALVALSLTDDQTANINRRLVGLLIDPQGNCCWLPRKICDHYTQ